ncbi:GDP-mannose transporter 1 [Colletotrichum chlorophyti]|uniref:GDP-mannose transporter n=1 Tax=Colletotrichum chlorophyti TaxID=708187 RepID=A0A1Q8S655_9PEZI|nr:GDP-mannose transporter 1 [Colletotrichum chlorophyti]
MAENEKGDFVIRFPNSPHTERAPSSVAGPSSYPPLNGPGDTSSGASRVENSATLSIVAYCLSSISMTIVNKYVVSGSSWNLTFFYLAVQAVVSTTAIILAKRFQLIHALAPFDRIKAKKWFPVSLLLVGMIYTGNKGLQFLSVPVYTIFKNLTIIIIAYGEVVWFGGKVTPLALLSFGLMVLSSIVATWADQRSANDLSSSTNDRTIYSSTLNIGYTWMGLNVLCSACYLLSMRKVIKKMHFGDWDTMFYNNLLKIPVLIVCSLTTEDWSAANLANNFPESSRNKIVIGMIYSGLAAIFISYSSAWCIRVTSSTTYSMVGALNKLPLAISGLLFFSVPVTVGSVSAIAIGFVSGIVYSWARMS